MSHKWAYLHVKAVTVSCYHIASWLWEPGEVSRPPECNLLPNASNHFHSAGREHPLGRQTLLTLTYLVCAKGLEGEVGGWSVVSRASLAQFTPRADWLRETEWRSAEWMEARVDFMPRESFYSREKKVKKKKSHSSGDGYSWAINIL